MCVKVQFVGIRTEIPLILVDGNLKDANAKPLVKSGAQTQEVGHRGFFGDVHDSFTDRSSLCVKLLASWVMFEEILGDGCKAIALRFDRPIVIEVRAIRSHVIEELQTSVVFLAAALDGLEVY